MGNIDPEEIKNKITPKTKAVMITHMWGIPCDMDRIVSICKENDLMLFEDISHAFGAKYKDKLVGTFGTASACSLQSQKVLTGGEGGFILTNNDEIYYRSLLLGHYNKRCKNEIPSDYELSEYSITGMGLKLRIHPIAASIALQQLNNVDKIIERRERIANLISEELNHLSMLKPIFPHDGDTSSWYAMVFKFNGSEEILVKLQEECVKLGLKEVDIPSSTKPLNTLPLFQRPEKIYPSYKGLVNYKDGDFPVAEKFYKNIIKLPIWSEDQDLEIIKKYNRDINLPSKNC